MSGLRLIQRGGIFYATGTIGGQRIRKSLGTGDRQAAEEARAQYEARLWKRHTYGEEAVRTFEEAALSYLEQGGEGRFLAQPLVHFKGRAVASITPGQVRAAALAIYPDAAAVTRNRQAITPISAVINHAHDLGWCGAIRVKRFPAPKSTKHKPVTAEWLRAFMAQADKDGLPHLASLVLFMHDTAARRSEAVRLMGDHVDLTRRVAVLAKTKTDEWVPVALTAQVVLRIGALDPKPGQPVFGYTDPSAVNRAMKRVCTRAGIEPRSTHAAGRHSYATNAMARGARVKQAAEAGRWKSMAHFMQTYVHEERAGQEIADQIDTATGPIGTNLAQKKNPGRYRPWNKGRS